LSKSISNLIRSNYAINNFQTDCWFCTGVSKYWTSVRYCIWITPYERDFSSSVRSGF
jgi:hypothetical protein